MAGGQGPSRTSRWYPGSRGHPGAGLWGLESKDRHHSSVGPLRVLDKQVWEAEGRLLRGNLQAPFTDPFDTFLLCTCLVLGRHVLVAGGTPMSEMEVGHAFKGFGAGSRKGRRRGFIPFHSDGSWDPTNGMLLDQ